MAGVDNDIMRAIITFFFPPISFLVGIYFLATLIYIYASFCTFFCIMA